jgi:hypothetical protein
VFAREPLPRWSRWFIGVVGFCVVGLIAWGAWPKWSSATIGSVTVEGARLEVLSDACGSDVRTDVDEGADAVTLTVSVYDEGSQGDCGGSQTTVALDEPLGDRLLVDGSDDVVLTCEPSGAATQECGR